MRLGEYVSRCTSQSKHNRAVATAVLLIAGYSLWTTLAPLVGLPSVPSSVPQIPLPWLVALILLLALFGVMHGGYRFSQGLESRIKELEEPKLEIVFERRKPFIDDHVILQPSGHGGKYFRVGIKTDSLTPVRKCHLVLENCSPPVAADDPGVHLGLGFRVMGSDPRQEWFDVLPNEGKPSLHVDIAYEDLKTHTFCLAYAQPVVNEITKLGGKTMRALHFKLLGGGPPVSRSFLVIEEAGRLRLEPYRPPPESSGSG